MFCVSKVKMVFPIAPIVAEILFVPPEGSGGTKKLQRKAGTCPETSGQNARTIRFHTKKINSSWQIYVYCTKVKTLSVINCV